MNTNLLENLTEQEKEYLFSILKDIEEGDDSSYSDLIYEDYNEIPVDIYTFLHDRRYLGNGLIDDEGRYTVFPYWEEKLKEIFPTNLDTAYNTVVLSGAIGLGKSFVAVLCILYLLYRMLCLKDPYKHYGLQPIDKITFSFMNITLEAAKGVAWDKCQQLVQASPWFMSHGIVNKAQVPEWQPDPKLNIELMYGSAPRNVIGRAVYCLDGDTKILTRNGISRIDSLCNSSCDVLSLGPDLQQPNFTASEGSIETTKTNDVYEIELEDGTKLTCTPNHLFMLSDGTYKEAKDLTNEDDLMEIKPYGYVYKTTNRVNGKIYIGQKKSTEFIPSYLGSGKLLCKAVEKYGVDNFKVDLLCWCSSRLDLDEKEVEYISFFDSTDLNVGYNIALGGQGGWYHVNEGIKSGKYKKAIIRYHPTEEQKKILSQKALAYWSLPENKIKQSERLTGIKRTEEQRKHYSEAVKKRFLDRPETFVGANKGRKVISNVTTNEIRFIPKDDEVPEGWIVGNIRTKGHDCSYMQTEDWRKAISDRVSGSKNPMYGKGYLVSGDKNPMYGKHHTEATKLKIGAANKGRVYSDEINKKKGRPGVPKAPDFGNKLREFHAKKRRLTSRFIYLASNMILYGENELVSYLGAKGYRLTEWGIRKFYSGVSARNTSLYEEALRDIRKGVNPFYES